MLTKKSKYAIKALLELARNHDEGTPMRISDIAEKENIPRKFLEAILLDLRKHGILGSRMGTSGGYYLLKTPADIPLSKVLRITDGPIALVPCASLNFYEPCGECVNEASCSIRDVAREVRDASLAILSNTSIADLLAREKKLGQKKKKR